MKQRFKLPKWFNERNMLLFLLLSALIVLGVTPVVRTVNYDGLMVGPEAYYHTRIINTIAEHGLISEDTLVYKGRPYVFNLYHLSLAGISRITGFKTVALFSPILLGLLSIMFFYLILTELNVKSIVKTVTLFVFLLMPVFIQTFSSLNPESFIIFLQFLSIFLFLKTRHLILRSLTVVIFLLISFFGILQTVVVLAVVIALSFRKKHLYPKHTIFMVLITLVSAIILNIYIFGNTALQYRYAEFLISDIIFVFGSAHGLSLFAVILAGMGFIINWKFKTRNFMIMAFSLFLLLSSLYIDYSVLLVLGVFVAFMGALAVDRILHRKWEFVLLRNLTVLALFCGIIFSTLSYLDVPITEEPTLESKNSLLWLKDNALVRKTVFSHYSNGFCIQYFANSSVLLDTNLGSIPDFTQRVDDSIDLFYSRNLGNTTSILDKYEVSHIFITPEMKNGLVWHEEEEGLLFLFRNKEHFENIYNKDGYEIWGYVR